MAGAPVISIASAAIRLADGGDLVAAAPNASAAQHPCGALLDTVAVGRSRRRGPLSARAAGSTGRHRWVRAGPPALSSPVAVDSSAGVQRAVETDFVVDGARDLHADVVLLPRPAGCDGLLVEHQLVHGPPIVDDLVPHHPVLVGRVHCQQVDAARVGDSRSIRGQQALSRDRLGSRTRAVTSCWILTGAKSSTVTAQAS